VLHVPIHLRNKQEIGTGFVHSIHGSCKHALRNKQHSTHQHHVSHDVCALPHPFNATRQSEGNGLSQNSVVNSSSVGLART